MGVPEIVLVNKKLLTGGAKTFILLLTSTLALVHLWHREIPSLPLNISAQPRRRSINNSKFCLESKAGNPAPGFLKGNHKT
jgi:hypothetical protein